MTGKIILIGGDEITKNETSRIDDEIRRSHPKGAVFLFVPTAAGDSEGYIASMKRLFGKRFRVRVLRGTDGAKAAKEKIMAADVIYLGGGKTELLRTFFKRWNLIPLLKRAHKNGATIIGMSAGAEALSLNYAVVKRSAWKLRGGWGIAPVICLVHAKPTSAKQAFRYVRRQRSKKGKTFVAIGERAAWEIRVTDVRALGRGSVWVDGLPY
ncbi:Type 1 glutamine amidotransferase-like domain-containing protein [Candidatus Uhrbacteria bacterium]|nr:Type 1 glutamine amidotransferase-like domain-containing protein [Candidatus Uhrbacteria bacterium]